MDVRVVATSQLSLLQLHAVRRLLDTAFAGDFSEEDWQHACGGWHAVIWHADAAIAHASAVDRRLYVEGRRFATGYVEAVAVAPPRQGTGLGTAVMAAITNLVRRRFELGALSSGAWRFYERLGWERWRGPTYVRHADGRAVRSAEDDDGVMVLRFGPSAGLALTAPIACEARAGDSW